MRDSETLRWWLHHAGYSETVISAAWPAWWSEDAEGSASAQAELRFSLARKLGLDPRKLLEDEVPRFIWRNAKFKHLSTESEMERGAISAFGSSVGRLLVAGTPPVASIVGIDAKKLRESILATQPFVRLVDLLGLCWGVGIPVIHLRIFPLSAKRMCAMTVRIRDRFAILLARDSEYPAHATFYLAHEIAHVALEHVKDGDALVDLTDPLDSATETDGEELAGDRYALELLTGSPEITISAKTQRFTGAQLADNLLKTGPLVGIEPGTLALCFGYTTGDWGKAYAALKLIYTKPRPVWSSINKIAIGQLDWSAIPEDHELFLRAIINSPQTDASGG